MSKPFTAFFQYKIKINIPYEVQSVLCGDLEMSVRQEDKDLKIRSVYKIHCELQYEKNPKLTVLSIITFVCCSFSSLSLIILIVANRCRNFHVEIPFSNLENVAVSLLLSNLLFMIDIGAIDNKTLICYIVSISLHYLWLLVFSLTSFAVLHIVTTLLHLKERRFETRKCRKRRLMTYIGLLTPKLFVGPAVAMDLYGPNYFSPGYAKSVCFPTQYPGNLIFFTGPVQVSIIVNTVCRMSCRLPCSDHCQNTHGQGI